MHRMTQTVADRLASVLYDAAVSCGLEGRFDWSVVAEDYEKFALEVLYRTYPPPPANRTAYAQRQQLSDQPQGDAHPPRR